MSASNSPWSHLDLVLGISNLSQECYSCMLTPAQELSKHSKHCNIEQSRQMCRPKNYTGEVSFDCSLLEGLTQRERSHGIFCNYFRAADQLIIVVPRWVDDVVDNKIMCMANNAVLQVELTKIVWDLFLKHSEFIVSRVFLKIPHLQKNVMLP